MSIAKHNELVETGDIVGYGGSWQTFYGYKLLKKVYVEQLDAYVWLGQYGTVGNDNKFKADNGGKTIQVISSGDLKNDYHSAWTPDVKYEKGDILVGNDGTRVMLFVYISDSHVERLTARSDMGSYDKHGYSTLEDYKTNFGPLEIHTVQGYPSSSNGKRFSAL